MRNPKVHIFRSDWHGRILGLAKACEIECQGFLFVMKTQENEILLFNPLVLPQHNTGAHTRLDSGVLHEWVAQPGNAEREPRMLCWWHSHVDMPAHFSGEDVETMLAYANGTYFLALVVNRSGQYELSMILNKPTQIRIDCELVVDDNKVDSVFIDDAMSKIKTKFQEPATNSVMDSLGEAENMPLKVKIPEKFNIAWVILGKFFRGGMPLFVILNRMNGKRFLIPVALYEALRDGLPNAIKSLEADWSRTEELP